MIDELMLYLSRRNTKWAWIWLQIKIRSNCYYFSVTCVYMHMCVFHTHIPMPNICTRTICTCVPRHTQYNAIMVKWRKISGQSCAIIIKFSRLEIASKFKVFVAMAHHLDYQKYSQNLKIKIFIPLTRWHSLFSSKISVHKA